MRTAFLTLSVCLLLSCQSRAEEKTSLVLPIRFTDAGAAAKSLEKSFGEEYDVTFRVVGKNVVAKFKANDELQAKLLKELPIVDALPGNIKLNLYVIESPRPLDSEEAFNGPFRSVGRMIQNTTRSGDSHVSNEYIVTVRENTPTTLQLGRQTTVTQSGVTRIVNYGAVLEVTAVRVEDKIKVDFRLALSSPKADTGEMNSLTASSKITLADGFAQLVQGTSGEKKEKGKSLSQYVVLSAQVVPGDAPVGLAGRFRDNIAPGGAGVPGRGVASAGASRRPTTPANIESFLQSMHGRYDRDGNGVIEGDEFKQYRSAARVDTNKDGKVTLAEHRKYITDRLGNRFSSGPPARSGSTAPPSRIRQTAPRIRSAARPRPAPQRPRPTRTGNAASGGDRYQKYAETIIKKYDTDKSGDLSLEEAKKMSRDATAADKNKDGKITAKEYATWLMTK